MMQLKDGDRSSYPEIINELANVGSQVKKDSAELFRRMIFNILISNVDDHLRNHGFLLTGKEGWALSPVYDLNPTPQDVRRRVLTTSISPDNANCSIDLALEQVGYFNLNEDAGVQIIREVSETVTNWRDIAAKKGRSKAQIDRMSSAFEHLDLEVGLKL